MASPTPRGSNAVWTLLHQRPDLLLEHAQAYADLLREESAAWAGYWGVKLLWCSAALLLAGVGLTLAGVAVMLWSMAVVSAWLLVLVPAVAMLAALACGWAAWRGPAAPGLDGMRAQWDADRQLLSSGIS